MYIPKKHPRAESLKIRKKIVEAYEKGILATTGLIAHGRGECFDYIIGEKTLPFALNAEKAAVAALLIAEKPVISVNGNLASLCPSELVELSNLVNAKVEVNLFYRSQKRLNTISKFLKRYGLNHLLGVNSKTCVSMSTICSLRSKVDPEGLLIADVVLLSIEDGDRTVAYRKLGKTVIAIDLNPFSRTAIQASITVVDNVVRAFPTMVKLAKDLRYEDSNTLKKIIDNFDNMKTLQEAVEFINSRLMSFTQNEMLNHRYLSITTNQQFEYKKSEGITFA